MVIEVLSSRVPDLPILCKHLGKASWILLKKVAYVNFASLKLPPNKKNYMMGSNYILALLQRSLMFLSMWTILSEINVKSKAQAPDQKALFFSGSSTSISSSPFHRGAGLQLNHFNNKDTI